ncbi:hypothetical protein CONCODRAFT_8613 [Conidiobolus coronatus NRRL 28638]|uniref:Uncharacterized protein n=1 Tax=Conidiobolus coronatus (strain ATCC 28846 / CBS 209.66 / NRRL 28638) TaxID=796925 RepID=A0A137P2A0_CONC2|nr:hypothetical protein CONCODRAFT_8613 [Conidiobolus coronatus NRRL 28638]|eukprot:KXN69029.1 hypothetical protein CONCODRAFT_8613 [Conidiobolus coronatus NRRL 28638]
MKDFQCNQWLEQYVKVSITLGSLKDCYRMLKELYKKDSKKIIVLSLLYQIEMGYYYKKNRWFILGISILDINPRLNFSHGYEHIQSHYEIHGALYSVNIHLSVLNVISKMIDEIPSNIDFWRWLKKSLYFWKNIKALDQFDKDEFSYIFHDRLNFWMSGYYPNLTQDIKNLSKIDYEVRTQIYKTGLEYFQIKCSAKLLIILSSYN